MYTEFALTFSYWVEFEWLLSLYYRARRAEKVNTCIHTHTLLTFIPPLQRRIKLGGAVVLRCLLSAGPLFLGWLNLAFLSCSPFYHPLMTDNFLFSIVVVMFPPFLLSPPSHFRRSAAATVIFFTFNSSGWVAARWLRGRPVESSESGGRLGRRGRNWGRGGEGREMYSKIERLGWNVKREEEGGVVWMRGVGIPQGWVITFKCSSVPPSSSLLLPLLFPPPSSPTVLQEEVWKGYYVSFRNGSLSVCAFHLRTE